jgi:hypothetical protein
MQQDANRIFSRSVERLGQRNSAAGGWQLAVTINPKPTIKPRQANTKK